jgi:hypothetical protein
MRNSRPTETVHGANQVLIEGSKYFPRMGIEMVVGLSYALWAAPER